MTAGTSERNGSQAAEDDPEEELDELEEDFDDEADEADEDTDDDEAAGFESEPPLDAGEAAFEAEDEAGVLLDEEPRLSFR